MSSVSYAFGPLVALAAIAVLVVVLRWAFGGKKQSVVAREGTPGDETSYGMLVPLRDTGDETRCAEVVEVLRQAGIRANAVSTTDGPRVLVWPADATRSQRVADQWR